MSEKKSKSSKVPFFDRRAMEKQIADIGRLLEEKKFDSIEDANAYLEKISGIVPPQPPRTPLEKAQNLMYEAFDSTGKRRVELAQQALEISKDCADAYVLLAEETSRTLEEAKNLYDQGVKAGERALGPKAFQEDVGHFWGVIETRPYMRARKGLADCLWLLGERQAAIAHYQDMLRLNPGDNQGIRYILANCLLVENMDTAFRKLLSQYEDDIAADWLYSRALWRFRREGASQKANDWLKEAKEENEFVPAYLLGKKQLPHRLPDYVGLGDENEAISYAAAAIKLWQQTPGALEWLAGNLTGNNITKPKEIPFPKVGRNDPCPCGSGKKFKKCCGREQ